MKRNRNSVIRASYKISPGIHNRQVSVSWSGSWSAIQESLLQKDLLFIFACVCIIYAHLCGCSSVYVSVGARDWPQISFVVVLHFVYRGRVSHWSKLANLPQGSPVSISWVLGLYWPPCPSGFHVSAGTQSLILTLAQPWAASEVRVYQTLWV